ncbi:hypothetical protein ACIA8G_35335 [Lentzea sp. NPDC051213]|uniref:hypothetical protein n=1 Tax=Lentzea sp. NPDC051213 TaxID=3364126 RepID=UPI0037A9A71F
MIRAGRDVVDRVEIMQLHGLTESQGNRNKPWRKAGHPAPVGSQRQLMWDKQQATAFANGEPIPALPDTDAGEDLLDRIEAAQFAGMKPAAWESGHQRGTFPAPDDHKFGVPHWYRSTITAFLQQRAERAANGGYNPTGRPKGTTGSRPAKSLALEKRIRALLAKRVSAGQPPLSNVDLAQKLKVSVGTLRYHLGHINREDQADGADVQPEKVK